ncbi:MAG: hypothetical protein HC765_10715 [Brachymonas sp.]|nr:hypothetical protein [Brachymonas sp.]
MQWLIRSFAFTAAQARGKIPAYDERVRQFAAHTQQLLLAGYDEVLLVGHSSGTFLAISSLAQALRAMPIKAHAAPSISLLTLGHWTPMLSSLPAAQSFRDDLQTLAHAERVQWIDFGAPADGCCFALVDPLSAVDLAPPIKHPKLLSPRFAELFSPQRYKLLKKDRFDLHFQYIKASELFGEYDYFAITAGAQDLAQRFSHLPSVTDFRQFRLFG